VIEIDREPEQLLSSFKRQWRQNVLKALRFQTQVREDLDDAGLEMFQEIHRQMVAKKHISGVPVAYFRGIRDYFRTWPQHGFILSSWLGQELLGVVVIFTVGSQAMYGMGGSSLNHPGIPKTHLLQYIAMQHARARGCVVYDIGGVGAGFGDAEHRTPLQQMNFFKRGFGGREVDCIAGHERILKPISYHVIRSAKRSLAFFR
jgi:lipid II:glycine glycyltransferase (peptidoglycan interpeptide bridge formation enzyme)